MCGGVPALPEGEVLKPSTCAWSGSVSCRVTFIAAALDQHILSGYKHQHPRYLRATGAPVGWERGKPGADARVISRGRLVAKGYRGLSKKRSHEKVIQ